MFTVAALRNVEVIYHGRYEQNRIHLQNQFVSLQPSLNRDVAPPQLPRAVEAARRRD